MGKAKLHLLYQVFSSFYFSYYKNVLWSVCGNDHNFSCEQNVLLQ